MVAIEGVEFTTTISASSIRVGESLPRVEVTIHNTRSDDVKITSVEVIYRNEKGDRLATGFLKGHRIRAGESSSTSLSSTHVSPEWRGLECEVVVEVSTQKGAQQIGHERFKVEDDVAYIL